MRWDQSVERLSKYLRRLLATLIYRTGQLVRRNRVASAAAGLLLISLVGFAIANTWLVHRAQVANAHAEPLSNDVRQLAHLRRVSYYDTLDNLTGSARMKDRLTSDVPGLADDHNSLGSAMEGYRDTAQKNPSTVPATYEELVADNPRDRTSYRNISMTYANPGGVVNLAGVDPAALGPYAGDYLVLINQPQAALDAFRKRLTIDEQAVAADPGNFQVLTDLAYSASRIGDLLANMGDHAGALPYYQRAVDIYTKHVDANPEHFTIPQFAQLLGKLAKTHASLGYNEKASAECSKALDLLAVTDGANVEQRRIIASAYSEIADTYSLIARDMRTPQQFMPKLWTAARETYERSLAILVDLRERGVLSADLLAEIQIISDKIAECDSFLAN